MKNFAFALARGPGDAHLPLDCSELQFHARKLHSRKQRTVRNSQFPKYPVDWDWWLLIKPLHIQQQCGSHPSRRRAWRLILGVGRKRYRFYPEFPAFEGNSVETFEGFYYDSVCTLQFLASVNLLKSLFRPRPNSHCRTRVIWSLGKKLISISSSTVFLHRRTCTTLCLVQRKATKVSGLTN